MNYRILLIFILGFLNLPSYAYMQKGDTEILKSEREIPGKKSNNHSNNISGTVRIGPNKLNKGNIYLLNRSKNKYSADKIEKVIDGDFLFTGVKPGNYLLYVIPELNFDFLYFPKYIPTYFGRSYSWERASGHNINRNSLNLPLNLITFQDPFYGNKEISGKLIFQGKRGLENLPIPIILLNEKGKPVDFRIIDKNTGQFSFEHIPDGTYSLHPEIPGLKTYNYLIEFDGSSSEKYSNINFVVDDENIMIEETSEEIEHIVFGNYIKIFLEDDVNYPVICELIDLSGRTKIKNICYFDENIINTSGMATNLYILKIRTYDNQQIKTTKVFIKNY